MSRTPGADAQRYLHYKPAQKKIQCNKIFMTLGHGKEGGTGEYLIKAAESLFSEHKEALLTINSKGDPKLLYHTVLHFIYVHFL